MGQANQSGQCAFALSLVLASARVSKKPTHNQTRCNYDYATRFECPDEEGQLNARHILQSEDAQQPTEYESDDVAPAVHNQCKSSPFMSDTRRKHPLHSYCGQNRHGRLVPQRANKRAPLKAFGPFIQQTARSRCSTPSDCERHTDRNSAHQ